MPKLLSILGLTATGKTAFGLKVTQKYANRFKFIDLISADSRQLYQGMEVGTGVDLPATFKLDHNPDFTFPFFTSQNCRWHGVSILKPDQPWSVSQFQVFCQEVMKTSWSNGGLPILIGGTGLYRQQLFQSNPQLSIQPNKKIRDKVAQLSVLELQVLLKSLNAQRISQMNNSDLNNPRRLVRAIEIAVAERDSKNVSSMAEFTEVRNLDHLTLVLSDEVANIEKKVLDRVKKRLEQGMISEVQKLMRHYSEEMWEMLPAFSATGYEEVRAYLEEKISEEVMISLWTRSEVQYAKRQQTWFKKYAEGAVWFEVNRQGWQANALSQIQAWLE